MVEEHKLRPPFVEASVRPYQYSLSLDCNAKGWIQPSIKVQSDTLIMNKDHSTIEEVAILLLDSTINLLKKQGYKVATDIEEIPKEREKNGQ